MRQTLAQKLVARAAGRSSVTPGEIVTCKVDLAMMRLFGGFGERVFDAYDEAYPLAEGAHERVPLYQLYFLLAHVNLFGASYLGSVESAVDATL